MSSTALEAETTTEVDRRHRGRLVGRDAQLNALLSWILQPYPQQIVILGPAGIGKSTLGQRALQEEEVGRRFGVRRWFVRLDAASRASAARRMIATTMQLARQSSSQDKLLEELGKELALLVLDNLETLWDRDQKATKDLLVSLARVPGLTLVVTLRGSAPPEIEADPINWRELPLFALDDQASRELFCAIARPHAPSDPTLLDHPALPILLAKVGGVPLAITLLAKAARSDDPDNLLRQWDSSSRTALLVRRGGDVPGRDSSWEVSVEVSMSSPRLTPEARRLALVLAHLPDGIFNRDMDALLPSSGPSAASVLSGIALAFFENGRCRMLAPIREYLARITALALAAPSPGGRSDLPAWLVALEGLPEADRARALQLYGGLAQRLGPLVGFRERKDALEGLTNEAGNIEATLRMGLETGALAWVERTLDLTRFASLCGRSLPLEPALASARGAGARGLEAACLRALGDVDLRRLRREEARARFEQARALYEGLGDDTGMAECDRRLGDIATSRSDVTTARTRYEAALTTFRARESRIGEAECLFGIARLSAVEEKYEEARAGYEKALAVFEQSGDMIGEAECTRSLAELAMRLGWPDARRNYEAALRIYHEMREVAREVDCLRSLGEIALKDRPDDARLHFESARQLGRRLGDALGEARALQSLAEVALARSKMEDASAHYAEAQRLYRHAGLMASEAQCMERRGDVAAERGQFDEVRDRYEDAIELYNQIFDFSSTSRINRKLSRLMSSAPERAHAVSSAPAAQDDRASEPSAPVSPPEGGARGGDETVAPATDTKRRAKLDGAGLKRLHDALLDAFPSLYELRKMLLFGLGMNLYVIASENGSLGKAALDLIAWAHAQGEIGALVDAARDANDGNALLRAFAEWLRETT